MPLVEWNTSFERLKNLRLAIKEQFHLPIREEIHAVELVRIHKIAAYRNIKKRHRLQLLESFISALPNVFTKSKVINICLDKTKTDCDGFQDYSEKAWNRLIQRFDNFLKHEKAQGIIISDTTNEPKTRKLLRRMRAFNPVPSRYGGTRQAVTDSIIEDPFMRNSQHSYFIQCVDVISHCLYRKEYPKASLKKYNLHKLFNYVEPILLIEASRDDPLGIVRK